MSREDELRSLRAAREIGVDWVLGGTHGFTIGSAIFAGELPGGPGVAGQVAAVLAAASGAEVVG